MLKLKSIWKALVWPLRKLAKLLSKRHGKFYNKKSSMKNRSLLIFTLFVVSIWHTSAFSLVQDPVSFSIKATGKSAIALSDAQKAIVFYDKGTIDIQVSDAKQTLL
ncbi:MAG: hypothetical protein ACREYC_27650 [Gammaproteobacteria bacterium]